jgi:hypothetical protein
MVLKDSLKVVRCKLTKTKCKIKYCPLVSMPFLITTNFLLSILIKNVETTTKVMKSSNVNKEILLFTNTSFARRKLCQWNDVFSKEVRNSASSEFENACQSGLVFEMLPHIFNKNDRKKLCIWKVNQTEQFIHVELGNKPAPPQYKTSIDPYFFLPLIIYHN